MTSFYALHCLCIPGPSFRQHYTAVNHEPPQLVEGCDVLFLCVKPYAVKALLAEARPPPAASRPACPRPGSNHTRAQWHTRLPLPPPPLPADPGVPLAAHPHRLHRRRRHAGGPTVRRRTPRPARNRPCPRAAPASAASQSARARRTGSLSPCPPCQSVPPCSYVRVMPNTPCMVGMTAAALCLGLNATPSDGALVQRLFSAVGKIYEARPPALPFPPPPLHAGLARSHAAPTQPNPNPKPEPKPAGPGAPPRRSDRPVRLRPGLRVPDDRGAGGRRRPGGATS